MAACRKARSLEGKTGRPWVAFGSIAAEAAPTNQPGTGMTSRLKPLLQVSQRRWNCRSGFSRDCLAQPYSVSASRAGTYS
jgi:hypothetical protein